MKNNARLDGIISLVASRLALVATIIVVRRSNSALTERPQTALPEHSNIRLHAHISLRASKYQPESSNDFIKAQQSARAIAALSQSFWKLPLSWHHTSGAQDWLKDDIRQIVPSYPFEEACQVIVRDHNRLLLSPPCDAPHCALPKLDRRGSVMLKTF